MERTNFMTKIRKISSLAAVGAVLALAACETSGPQRMANVGPQTGVEGSWLDQQGVAVSRFNGGRFETVATDTGNRLAEGTYTYRDRQNVEISMRSLIRQTTSSVNCALVSPSQLNCTNSNGQQFTLTRSPGVS